MKEEKEEKSKEEDWKCKDDDKKYCRKLNDGEAKCYWKLQEKIAK